MARDLKGYKNIEKLVNELIKSPKQVKPIATQSMITDCVQVQPYNYIDGNVQEVIISNVSFISDFSLISIAANKLIIIEDCVFHSAMQIHCLKDARIIIRNCRFRQSPVIKAKRSQVSEITNIPDTLPLTTNLTPDTSYSSAIALLDTIILN